MRPCERSDVQDEPPFAFSYYDTATGYTPAEACINASQWFGPPEVATWDADFMRCSLKWPNGEQVADFVYQVCQAPAVDFEALGITSGQMTYVFSWGVAAVLGLWLLGYVIACGVQAINKA